MKQETEAANRAIKILQQKNFELTNQVAELEMQLSASTPDAGPSSPNTDNWKILLEWINERERSFTGNKEFYRNSQKLQGKISFIRELKQRINTLSLPTTEGQSSLCDYCGYELPNHEERCVKRSSGDAVKEMEDELQEAYKWLKKVVVGDMGLADLHSLRTYLRTQNELP